MRHVLNRSVYAKSDATGDKSREDAYKIPTAKTLIRMVFCRRVMSRLWMTGSGIRAVAKSVMILTVALEYL